MYIEVINLDQVELCRLMNLVELARKAVKRQRVKIAIVEAYGSWEEFVDKMLKDGSIK